MAIWSGFALYVVGINVFLSTSLFEKVVDQDPDTLFVSYRRGWSIWPGRVHARDLTIRSGDSQVQLVLRIERCTFDVSLTQLLAKKFHITHVEGAGIVFQARRRIAAPAAIPELVESLPRIPGFERIPLPSPQPPDLLERWDDRHYHLWTIQLEDVVAENVRQIWVDGVRFDGDARVTGGFFLRPIRSVRIRDVHVDVRSGHVTALQRPVVDPIAGTVDVDVQAFDPRTSSAVDLVHRLSMKTDLHGRSPDLANLPASLTSPLVVGGPGEWRRLALRIVDGKLAAGAHVDVGLPAATLELAPHRLSAEVMLEANVAEDAEGPRLDFHVAARTITATRTTAGTTAILFGAPALEVIGDARALDLGAPLRDVHLNAHLPASEMPDVRVLDAYLPGDAFAFSFEGGRANARANIELWLADRRAKGDLGLEADDLDLRVAKLRIRGGTILDASFDAWRWAEQRASGIKAKVKVAAGSIATADAPDRKLLDVRGFAIALDSPELDLDDPLRAFRAKVELPDGAIVDRGLLKSYLPRGKDMRIAQAGAAFDARCEVEVENHRGTGTFAVHAARIGFTLDELSLVTAVRASARVHDWAWEHGDLALDDAQVEITNSDARRTGAAEPALVIRRIALHAKSERFAFSDPLAHVELVAAVEGGRMHDPIALNAFLPRGGDVVFDVGPADARFDAQLRATVDRHVARGQVAAHGRGVGVRGTKIGVRGDVDAKATIEAWQLDQHQLRVQSSQIAFDDVAVSFAGAPSPDVRAQRIELQAKADRLDIAHPSLRGVDYRLVVRDARMERTRPLAAPRYRSTTRASAFTRRISPAISRSLRPCVASMALAMAWTSRAPTSR